VKASENSLRYINEYPVSLEIVSAVFSALWGRIMRRRS